MSDFDNGYEQACRRLDDLADALVGLNGPASGAIFRAARLLRSYGPNPTHWERGLTERPPSPFTTNDPLPVGHCHYVSPEEPGRVCHLPAGHEGEHQETEPC